MSPLQSLSEAELKQHLLDYRDDFRRAPQEGRGHLMVALAAIGEAAGRSLGMRPYPVQFMGGVALHQGYLAEMATGEGKTLTASLPAVLAAWSGKPCHVLTANDYLAARDAHEMAPLYHYCGVSVAAITGELTPEQRMESYQADVVYVTAKELLGDYLKDRHAIYGGPDVSHAQFYRWLARENDGHRTPPAGNWLLVRGLDTVIVDEADSLLIDEAVTPLILSAQRENPELACAVQVASSVANRLVKGTDYSASVQQRAVALKPSACRLMADAADQLPRLWQAASRREELLRQALMARNFYSCGQHYVIQDEKVVLLDEFTGRMTPNRSLSAGLHQAIEAFEGVPISAPTETLGQMSFQAFFRHFRRLSGTTGTGKEARGEFWQIYGLSLLDIPTHRPRQRSETLPIIFATEEDKWHAVLREIERLHALGRPLLVGVRSVTASERVAELVRAKGLPFELINAVRHQDEAAIVARAGQNGCITIATNMAGRGTDIKLSPEAAQRGGLHVIITECNESGRIDRQLVGRCGRQGDPGSVSTFLSLEDDLVQRFLPESIRRFLLIALTGLMPGAMTLLRLAFRYAQYRADALAFQRRQSVLQADDWLEKALPFAGDKGE